MRYLRLIATAVLVLALAPAASAISYRQDFSFGTPGTGPGLLAQPQGIAVDPGDGEVFVADSNNNRIQVFDSDGAVARQFGTLGVGNGQLAAPAGVGVSPVAPFDVYVADTANNRVERFTNAGAFVGAFGTSGTALGQFQSPRAIAFDPQGNVYVGDTTRVTRFAADGTAPTALAGLASFQQLGGLTNSTGASARLYATDAQSNLVTGFNFTGNAGTSFQGGVVTNPQGIGVQSTDTTATIFVADPGHNRVAVFGGGGSFLKAFGPFTGPTGVAYSAFNQRVYVVDQAGVSAWQAVPDPVLGKSMDIQVDTGTVRYKAPGAKKFKKLTKVTLVKSGTIIDARRGTVSITSITAGGTLQSADFFKGIFKAIQRKRDRGLTNAQLVGGNFKACPGSTARATKKTKPVRQLWANGKGQFKTTGRYLSAAIRGTAWQMIDTCSGSTVKVTEGSVTVRDFLLKKTVVVNAGGFYSVTAPHSG